MCFHFSSPIYIFPLGIARVVSSPSPPLFRHRPFEPGSRTGRRIFRPFLPFFPPSADCVTRGCTPPPLQPRYSIIIIGRTSERSLRLQFSPPLLPLPPPLYPSRRALDPGEWKEGAAQLHTHTSIEKGEAKLGGEEEGTEIEEKTVQKIFSGGLHHSCLFGESLLWSGH